MTIRLILALAAAAAFPLVASCVEAPAQQVANAAQQVAADTEPAYIFTVDSLGQLVKMPLRPAAVSSAASADPAIKPEPLPEQPPRPIAPASQLQKAEEEIVPMIVEVPQTPEPEPAEPTTPPRFSGFAWGGAIGVGIDMSSHDMSTVKASVVLGYKTLSVPLIGVGAGVNMMMSNSFASFPLFAVARTNFGATRSPLFIEMRAGAIITNLNKVSRTALYLSPGIGINLATGDKFRSYLTVSYEYNGLKYTSPDDPTIGRIRGIDYVSASIGIVF